MSVPPCRPRRSIPVCGYWRRRWHRSPSMCTAIPFFLSAPPYASRRRQSGHGTLPHSFSPYISPSTVSDKNYIDSHQPEAALPSGRKLSYVKPRMAVNKFGRDGLTYEGISENKKWSGAPILAGERCYFTFRPLRTALSNLRHRDAEHP